MTKYTTIPAGYRVTVTSWENDADNYKTESVDGLSKEFTQFLVDFVKLFSSKNSHTSKGIGNLYDPSQKEIDAATNLVEKVVLKHRDTVLNSDVADYFFDSDGFCEDGWTEYAYDLRLTGGDFWTRVMDSYKVEYTPETIKIQDVTEEFK